MSQHDLYSVLGARYKVRDTDIHTPMLYILYVQYILYIFYMLYILYMLCILC